jgi:glycine/D-amino acid oxidase-like deaminating enzyme
LVVSISHKPINTLIITGTSPLSGRYAKHEPDKLQMTMTNSPITNKVPQQFSAALPDNVDVVIIGGGVIGISTALHLSTTGLKVLVCEKGRIAGEQSSRNWGWIRQQGRDIDELPIMMESRRIWQDWSDKYGNELGFKVSGVLHLADTEQRAEKHQEWMKTAKEFGVDSALMSRSQLSSQVGDSKVWRSGLLTASDARAEPWQAVPHLAMAAEQAGVTIIENCAVRTIESSNQQVCAVHTEMGAVKCEQALVCGGAWSALLLRNAGIGLPQLTVKATVAQSAPCDAGVERNVSDSKISFRKRADGGYTIALTDKLTHLIGKDSFLHGRHYAPILRDQWRGISPRIAPTKRYPGSWLNTRNWDADSYTPFEASRVLSPAGDSKVPALIKERLKPRNAVLANTPIVNLWAGMIDTMPDIIPVLDQAPQCAGLWIATGLSGHGFGIGPGVGRVMADLMQGKPAGHELQRFRYNRFYDGSKLKLGPMI